MIKMLTPDQERKLKAALHQKTCDSMLTPDQERKLKAALRQRTCDSGRQQKIKSIIAEQLGVDECQITPEARFAEDLGADSLDQVELVMAFEEAFGVDIPDEAAEKLQTVGDVYRYADKF